MRTRSNILSKAILFVLMAALTLVIYFPVAATTNSTTLTTTVPGTVPLLLELTGNGTVTINGVAYTNSGTIEIPRNSRIELHITPDAGNKIKSVIYDGRDCASEANSGKLTLPAITESATLRVSFVKVPSTPQTGDSYYPMCWMLLMLISMVGITAILMFRKKKTY